VIHIAEIFSQRKVPSANSLAFRASESGMDIHTIEQHRRNPERDAAGPAEDLSAAVRQCAPIGLRTGAGADFVSLALSGFVLSRTAISRQ